MEVTDESHAGLKTDVEELKTKTAEMEERLNVDTPKQADDQANVEKLVEKKIKEADFSTKTQIDFKQLLKSTDPAFTNIQKDVVDIRTTTNTNKSAISKMEQQLGSLSSQIYSRSPVTNPQPHLAPPPPPPIPPPVPPFRSTELPYIPHCPPDTGHLSSRQMHHNTTYGNAQYQPSVPSQLTSVEYSAPHHHSTATETLELLLCFDLNGRHIDRKKRWKKNNSDYKRCPTLDRVFA